MRQKSYPVYLHFSEEDEAWVAEVPDLPGCIAHGDTKESALDSVERAKRLWLSVAKDDGRRIPQPFESASGKFVVRLPRSLHHRLQIMAREENVSLNQLVLSLLSGREAEKRTPKH